MEKGVSAESEQGTNMVWWVCEKVILSSMLREEMR